MIVPCCEQDPASGFLQADSRSRTRLHPPSVLRSLRPGFILLHIKEEKLLWTEKHTEREDWTARLRNWVEAGDACRPRPSPNKSPSRHRHLLLFSLWWNYLGFGIPVIMPEDFCFCNYSAAADPQRTDRPQSVHSFVWMFSLQEQSCWFIIWYFHGKPVVTKSREPVSRQLTRE